MYVYIYIYIYIYIYTVYICTCCLFNVYISLRKTENSSLFSLVGKRQAVISIWCFSKCANLWPITLSCAPCVPYQLECENIWQ